jgi:hypothetical protein
MQIMLYFHKNVFTNLLQWNHLAKLKQTWNGWFLNGPLSKMDFQLKTNLFLPLKEICILGNGSHLG